MEYEWSIDKIKRQKNQTQNLLWKTKGFSKEEKQVLKKIIHELNEMENSLLPNKIHFSFPYRTKYIDSNYIIPVNTYLSYRDDIPFYIKEIILDAILCFQQYNDTYDSIELPILKISNQELVEMSYNFYSWLPNKEYLKFFKKYTNPNNHLLRFTHNQVSDFMGETSFFYYPSYRPYFSIDRSDTITDFITLNHEIAHGIMFRNDTTTSQKNEHYFLMELEGSFFDFLSIQYLKQFLSKEIIQELEYTTFITQYNTFSDFYITDLAIKLFESGRNISIVPIQRYILKQNLPFYFDESIINLALQNDPLINSKYLISYLTSLDLEVIYENDPEQAFYLFEKIRNNKTDSLFENLDKNSISFVGENENYEPFQKVIQKMNQLGKNKY